MVAKAFSPQFLELSSRYQNRELLKDEEIHFININLFQMYDSNVASKRDLRKLSSTN